MNIEIINNYLPHGAISKIAADFKKSPSRISKILLDGKITKENIEIFDTALSIALEHHAKGTDLLPIAKTTVDKNKEYFDGVKMLDEKRK